MRFLLLLTALSAALPSLHAADPVFDAGVEQIRAKHGVPALAVLAMIDGKVLVASSVGVRKFGASQKVTVNDLWHLGSNTKSMTATLAAMAVDEGKLKWETTVGEVFPEFRARMPEAWRGVTLEQLLTHRSGAPGDAPPDLWAEAWKLKGPPLQQRLAFVQGLVTRPPEAPPGSKYIYSNQGYAIAGAMLERVLRQPWEQLLRERLFEPLGMKSAGFGAPAAVGQINQPWGHNIGANGAMEPVPPGPGADNPPAIGPAATVHCSLADYARYAEIHARGERLGWGTIKPATFVKLHTAVAGQDYGMGWIVAPEDWAGGNALTHDGSNTMFFAEIWIAPIKDAVVIAAANVGGKPGNEACDEACEETIARLRQRFMK